MPSSPSGPPRPPGERRPPREVELLEARPLHAGPIFEVVRERVRLPSGLEQTLEVVVHGGAVAIAARRADGRLVCVRQYRHALGEWLVEVPAGRLEEGEEPLEAARRELEEETGLRAARWRELANIVPAPGFCSERVILFEACELEEVPGGGRPADADEEIELLALTPDELLRGATSDAKTLIAAALVRGA